MPIEHNNNFSFPSSFLLLELCIDKMLSQSFLFFRKQTHLCVCIIFKITCETKSQVSGNFAHTPPHTPTHTHTLRWDTTSLVHATHSLTLINDLAPRFTRPVATFGLSHIKFSTRKPEAVQAKAAFYVSGRREGMGSRSITDSGCIHGLKIVVVH